MALEGACRGAQLLVGEGLAPEPALVEAREAGKADAREVVSVAEETDLPARAVERVEEADADLVPQAWKWCEWRRGRGFSESQSESAAPTCRTASGSEKHEGPDG